MAPRRRIGVRSAGKRHTTPGQGSGDPGCADRAWMEDTGGRRVKSEHKARGSWGWQRCVGQAMEVAGAEQVTRSQSIGTWCPGQRGSWGLCSRLEKNRVQEGAQLGVRERQACSLPEHRQRGPNPGQSFGVRLWRDAGGNAPGDSQPGCYSSLRQQTRGNPPLPLGPPPALLFVSQVRPEPASARRRAGG